MRKIFKIGVIAIGAAMLAGSGCGCHRLYAIEMGKGRYLGLG